LTAIRDVALISLGGPALSECRTSSAARLQLPGVARRCVADFQSRRKNDICFLVSKPHAHATVDALRKEFAQT